MTLKNWLSERTTSLPVFVADRIRRRLEDLGIDEPSAEPIGESGDELRLWWRRAAVYADIEIDKNGIAAWSWVDFDGRETDSGEWIEDDISAALVHRLRRAGVTS